jgi:hypothetical protein
MTYLIIYCVVCYVVTLIAIGYLISDEKYHDKVGLGIRLVFAPILAPIYLFFLVIISLILLGEWFRLKTGK